MSGSLLLSEYPSSPSSSGSGSNLDSSGCSWREVYDYFKMPGDRQTEVSPWSWGHSPPSPAPRAARYPPGCKSASCTAQPPPWSSRPGQWWPTRWGCQPDQYHNQLDGSDCYVYLRVQQGGVKEGAGGGEDGSVAEIAGLAYPEDGVAPGLVTVQSVHHVLVQVLALELHLHLGFCPPHLTSQLNSWLYQHLETSYFIRGHCIAQSKICYNVSFIF